ncbi:MAG: uracil-DNA glycosylase family protein [Planctomycetota bacterium]
MRWKFGPVFYRGRLDKSARLMIIGSDPGPTECLPYVRRGFIGDSGQRVQGLLTKIGLTKSYLSMNSFAYALFPSASNAGKGDEVNSDTEIVAWRNKVYSAAVGPNLQAIVIFGFQGKKAYELWTGKPKVPMFYLPHPSRFDGEPDSNLLPAWKNAVTKLRTIVTPDDAALAAKPNYGEEFTELDFSPIPRRDLPKGATINGVFVPTPDYIGDDSWTRIVPIHNIASRPKPDNGKDLIVTSPDMTKTRIRATPNPSGKQSDPPTFTSTPF